MKKKYRNRLPKGAEVTGFNAHIENGEIIVEVELKDKFLPKDGDFLVSSLGNVFIYSDKKAEYDKYYCCYCGIHDGGQILTHFSNLWTNKLGCRFATPEEKADFLKRLETEEHLRWNAGTKKLEYVRWRAQGGETYYCLNSWGEVIACMELNTEVDKYRHEIGNYFRTEDAAKPYAEKMIEFFKNSKAE